MTAYISKFKHKFMGYKVCGCKPEVGTNTLYYVSFYYVSSGRNSDVKYNVVECKRCKHCSHDEKKGIAHGLASIELSKEISTLPLQYNVYPAVASTPKRYSIEELAEDLNILICKGVMVPKTETFKYL